MKKQAFNPYLPADEFIPDGEPYVFDGRVYIFGSHDRCDGRDYCLDDYACWSAPLVLTDAEEWSWVSLPLRYSGEGHV